VCQATETGNPEAVSLTNDAISAWHPKFALLIGIAASGKGPVLGDVVVCKGVWYQEGGKVTPQRTLPEPRYIPCDRLLLQFATTLPQSPHWWERITCPRPDGLSTTPTLHYGPSAAGEKVISDSVERDRLLSIDRKIAAIDMEDYGFAMACNNSEPRTPCLIFRAIVDDASPSKGDLWHCYAAEAASALAKHFLLSYSSTLQHSHSAISNAEVPPTEEQAYGPSLKAAPIIVALGSSVVTTPNRAVLQPAPQDLVRLFRRIEQIVARIDKKRQGHIRIVNISDEWPDWVRLPMPHPTWSSFKYVPYPTGDPELDERALIASGFTPPSYFSDNRNETIALFCGFRNGFKSFDYYPIKYRTKLALLEQELPHATLSGGSVLLAADGRSLYIHERTKSTKVVHEALGRRHSFCGSARVGSDSVCRDADMSLRAACARETQEESGEAPVLSSGQIGIVEWSQRMNHGNRSITHSGIDAVYLGAIATRTSDLKTKDKREVSADGEHWEGYVVDLPLTHKTLVSEFTSNYQNWFPTGIAQHLIWLAVGAPNACVEIRNDAKKILLEILDRLERV